LPFAFCFVYRFFLLSTRYATANLFLCGAPPHDPASPVRAYRKALPKELTMFSLTNFSFQKEKFANTASRPGSSGVAVGSGIAVGSGVGTGGVVGFAVGFGVGVGVGVAAGFIAKHAAHSGFGSHGSALSVPASISSTSL